MCSSRYPTSSSGLRAASPIRAGSRPNRSAADRTLTPSRSVRSHQSSCQFPATAKLPVSAVENRVPSSSENATTSSANGSSAARGTSRAATSIALTTPSIPS